MNMWTGKFWQATATRAVRTAAQVLAGFMVADVALWDIDWAQALGVTGTATVLSVLMSLMGPAGPDKGRGDGPGAPVVVAQPVEEYHGKRRAEDRYPGGDPGGQVG